MSKAVVDQVKLDWFVQWVRVIMFKSDLDAQIIFLYTFSEYATPEDLFHVTEELYRAAGFDKVKLAKLSSFLHLLVAKVEELDRKLMRKVMELALVNRPDSPSKEQKRYRLLSIPAAPKMRRSSSQPIPPLESFAMDPPLRTHSDPAMRECHIRDQAQLHSLDVRYAVAASQLIDLSKLDILKYGTSKIAKQLTIIDHELMSAVKMSEIRNRILRPHIHTYETITNVSNRFNQVSYWVATQIVIAPSPRSRVDIIEKFIEVAAKLHKYNNFQGALQIVSGLNNSNIQRLRTSWKSVSPKSMQLLQKVESVLSQIGNYSQYRAAAKECLEKKAPAVPLFGLLQHDLTVIHEGNPSVNTDGKPNLDKWQMFGNCMLIFSNLIENKYSFHKVPLIRRMLLDDLLVLPETLIMKHSYAIEARRRTPLIH